MRGLFFTGLILRLKKGWEKKLIMWLLKINILLFHTRINPKARPRPSAVCIPIFFNVFKILYLLKIMSILISYRIFIGLDRGRLKFDQFNKWVNGFGL